MLLESGLIQKYLYRFPACYAVRAALVFIAVDIETVPELGRSAVLTKIFFAADFDCGAQLEQGRARDGIRTATNV